MSLTENLVNVFKNLQIFTQSLTKGNRKKKIQKLLQKFRPNQNFSKRKIELNLCKPNKLKKIYFKNLLNIIAKIQNNLIKLEKVTMAKIGNCQEIMFAGGIEKIEEKKNEFQCQLNEFVVKENPIAEWKDIVGHERAQRSLQERIILPMKYPEIFSGARMLSKGILLYGPPGNGKAMLAKACATECNSVVFSVSSTDLMSKFINQSVELIKNLFEMARNQAKQNNKTVFIFINEIDAMSRNCSEGENEVSRHAIIEFLVQMNGIGTENDNTIVIGATSLPWALDPAIRRRFEKRIYVPLPNELARFCLLKHFLKQIKKYNITELQIHQLSQKLIGYSAKDLEMLVKDTELEQYRKAQKATKFQKFINNEGKIRFKPVVDSASGSDIVTKISCKVDNDSLELPLITAEEILLSTIKIKPSTGKAKLDEYATWTEEFGGEDQKYQFYNQQNKNSAVQQYVLTKNYKRNLNQKFIMCLFFKKKIFIKEYLKPISYTNTKIIKLKIFHGTNDTQSQTQNIIWFYELLQIHFEE